MHLEGALTPELLFKLAARNEIKLPTDDRAFESVASLTSRYDRFTSLDDFLQYYYIGMSVLISESDFESLAWDYFEHAAADNVAHAGKLPSIRSLSLRKTMSISRLMLTSC